MTFITQPTKEGETKECEECGVDLIARWTDYKGQWKDKLQWQTVEPRKSHYTKDGDCKDSTGTASNTTIQENSTVETTTGDASEKAILESILLVLIQIRNILENEDKKKEIGSRDLLE